VVCEMTDGRPGRRFGVLTAVAAGIVSGSEGDGRLGGDMGQLGDVSLGTVEQSDNHRCPWFVHCPGNDLARRIDDLVAG
jgi:hypothetical protein